MGHYRVILADPPWSYQRTRGDGIAAKHYQTMPLDAIKALAVHDLADRDSALLLWATMPLLPDAMQVMQAWGFRYVTCAFTWVKTYRNGQPRMGLGHYTRQNAELCLLGLRGTMKRREKDVSQIILEPLRQHSRKPDCQCERIMRLFDGPYVELFSRQRWPGWDVWGNQTTKFPAQPFLMPEAV